MYCLYIVSALTNTFSFSRNNGLLEEFTGKYSNELWPKVHKYLSTKTTPLQYTEYKGGLF